MGSSPGSNRYKMVVLNTYFFAGGEAKYLLHSSHSQKDLNDRYYHQCEKKKEKEREKKEETQRSAEKVPVNLPTNVSQFLPSPKISHNPSGPRRWPKYPAYASCLLKFQPILGRIYFSPPLCELPLCLSPDQDSLSFPLCTTTIPVYRTIPETKQANPSYRKYVPVASQSSISPSCQIISPNFPSGLWMAPTPSCKGTL